MSLATEIAKRASAPTPNQPLDEFGIPAPDPETPEYLVARALIINQHGLEEDQSIGISSLHLRQDQIFQGHSPIKEDKTSIYRLTQLKRPLKEWEVVEFWRLLRQYLPRLNRKILRVAQNLYWDTDKAELIDYATAKRRSTPPQNVL